MRQLKLTIGEPSRWEAYYSVSGEAHMLFCPSEETISVGEVLRVRVAFSGGPQFLLGGVVVWRRTATPGATRLRPGVGLRLNPSERSKVQYIKGYARGGLLDKRGAQRLPLRLRITYRASGARRVNFSRDLTTTGVLLGTSELMSLGTTLDLSIASPLDHLPTLSLRGEVVRHVEDDRGRAVGISFRFADAEEEQRTAQVVRDIERAFHNGLLGDEHIAL